MRTYLGKYLSEALGMGIGNWELWFEGWVWCAYVGIEVRL